MHIGTLQLYLQYTTTSSSRPSRSTRAPRRSRRRARGRSSATSIPTRTASRPTRSAAALTPRPRPSSRSTCSATSRRWRELEALGVPVLEDAAQAAGTLAADGRARGHSAAIGDVQLLSVQEPRRLRRRRRDHHRRRGAGASASARCASTARATRSPTRRSATTRAWTSCRPRSCACSCRTSTRGPTAAARLAVITPPPGWASSCRSPSRRRERAGVASLRRAQRARRRASPRPVGARDRRARLLPRAGPSPDAMRLGGGVVAAGHRRARGTHLAIPMVPVLSAEQAVEVTGAVAEILG